MFWVMYLAKAMVWKLSGCRFESESFYHNFFLLVIIISTKLEQEQYFKLFVNNFCSVNLIVEYDIKLFSKFCKQFQMFVLCLLKLLQFFCKKKNTEIRIHNP